MKNSISKYGAGKRVDRRTFMAGLGLVSIGLPALLERVGAGSVPVDLPCFPPEPNGTTPGKIVIVGDLQRTTLIERLFLSREQNDKTRQKVVAAIAAEEPDVLLLLGDMVSTGEDERDWEYFDALIAKITRAHIPIYAALGNHDYGLIKRGSSTLQLCYRRFPRCRNRPDIVALGAIGLITVDSNFDLISPAVIKEQSRLYRDALARFDADPTIQGVIVASHHPPYTNSSLGSNQDVIEQFAIPFMAARKTKIFFSGHVHSYERFRSDDKMFVVSGGGGGPRRPVLITPDRQFQNDEYRKGAIRPFHYIRMFITTTAIELQVMMYVNDQFVMGDRFVVDLEASGGGTDEQ